MKLEEIINIVAESYPGDTIMSYWNEKKQCPYNNPNGGDSLAYFLVSEMASIHDEGPYTQVQLVRAIDAVDKAIGDLRKVREGLFNALKSKK